jgi:hypothetical protein
VGFEPTIPTIELLHTNPLDRAATGIAPLHRFIPKIKINFFKKIFLSPDVFSAFRKEVNYFKVPFYSLSQLQSGPNYLVLEKLVSVEANRK